VSVCSSAEDAQAWLLEHAFHPRLWRTSENNAVCNTTGGSSGGVPIVLVSITGQNMREVGRIMRMAPTVCVVDGEDASGSQDGSSAKSHGRKIQSSMGMHVDLITAGAVDIIENPVSTNKIILLWQHASRWQMKHGVGVGHRTQASSHRTAISMGGNAQERAADDDVDNMLVGFETKKSRTGFDDSGEGGRNAGGVTETASARTCKDGDMTRAPRTASHFDALSVATSSHCQRMSAVSQQRAEGAARSMPGADDPSVRPNDAIRGLKMAQFPRQMRQPMVRWVPVSQDLSGGPSDDDNNKTTVDCCDDDGLVPDGNGAKALLQSVHDASANAHTWQYVPTANGVTDEEQKDSDRIPTMRPTVFGHSYASAHRASLEGSAVWCAGLSEGDQKPSSRQAFTELRKAIHKSIQMQAQKGKKPCIMEPLPLGLRLGISRTNTTLKQELLKAGFDLVD